MTQIVVTLAVTIIRLLEFCFFARAIMSWFMQARSSKIYEFLYEVTEPIILPFRQLFDRFEFMRGMPLDISFLCAFLVLEFLRYLLAVAI